MTQTNEKTREEEILDFWRDADVMRRSFTKPSPRGSFVFYEGPPTANGKPGIHHVAARAIKDLYPRFRTMQGYRVLRRAGWDTHGLPVEVEVEKKIGSKGKQDIEKYGIAEFNQLCKDSVFTYITDWQRLTERIGFWLDLDHPYITYENNYIETCWWILKDLFTRGFLYEAYRTTMHCPRCNTSLADHEVSLGMREDVDDPSVWPKFRLDPEWLRKSSLAGAVAADPSELRSVFLLAWTTTPWTLPANVALCLKPDASYALVEGPARHGAPEGPRELYVVAEALVAATFAEGTFNLLHTFDASALLGARYEPIAEGRLAGGDPGKLYTVIADPFVSLEDGTGIVHIAPAYGDLDIGIRYGLPTIFSVDLSGFVVPEVKIFGAEADVTGLFFKEADKPITQALTRAGRMFRSARVKHAYPFCWRDDTPLLFYAKNSWYIRTAAIKDKLLRNNDAINWVPPHIRTGRFGHWLENNVDWSLSRERYWGCPLPIWRSDDGRTICVGSVEDLSTLAGRDLSHLDLHRPFVDDVTFESDGATFSRVPYTIDVWFESGAMPYAQWHFPFENQKEFYENFPADFISEALDQTRGWFYTLHALATLLTDTGTEGRAPGPLADRFPDTSAFKNCVVLGLLTDARGKKMSKSRGNVVEPWSVLDRQGADALRWYMYSSGPVDQTKAFDVEKVTEVLRTFIMTLRSTHHFYSLYAEIDHPDLAHPIPVAKRPEIDRWLIADLNRLIVETTAALEAYDATTASRAVQTFVVDHLSNWYVRNNRRRFWKSTELEDKLAAYQTLFETLTTIAKLIAPMVPFVAEELYRALVLPADPAAPDSVHLAAWPVADDSLIDRTLIAEMDLVLRVVELGRSARAGAEIRTRQPLPEVIVRVGSEAERTALRRLEGLVLGELNVKKLTLLDVNTRFVSYKIRPNLPVVGKQLGPATRHFAAALAEIDPYIVVDNIHHNLPTILRIGGEEVTLEPNAFLISVQSPEGYAAVEAEGLMLALNTEVTPELRAEGRARELVRHVQEARKQAGFHVADRIHLGVETEGALAADIGRYRDSISEETLVSDLAMKALSDADFTVTVEIDGRQVAISIRKA